jgi:hypothetical protein
MNGDSKQGEIKNKCEKVSPIWKQQGEIWLVINQVENWQQHKLNTNNK